MEVKQIFEFVNGATQEVLGETAVVNEDLSNIVDIGASVFNANAYDRYVKALINRIGKTIFVNRVYEGGAPNILMDGWEFGSVLQKVHADLPQATENESWELEDNTSYDPNIFYKPSVSVKFYNSKTTFEIPISITERQVKQSFISASELNSFISMLYTGVENSLTLKLDGLIFRTINNLMAETIYADYQGANLNSKSGVKAVNLLYLYNTTVNAGGTALTTTNCWYSKEFIRFASTQISLYIDRIKQMSTLFNIGGKERFTPKSRLHVVMLNDFVKRAQTYLESDTFHNELVALPRYETVAFWQGSGTDYAITSTSKIDVDTASGHTVTATGIIGVMFDHYACGVCNVDRRVTSNYNPKAEFYNSWYKNDASYFNDFNENCIVFFVA